MLFRKDVSTTEARAEIEKAAMRRALYEWLWQQTHPANGQVPACPCPSMSDEQIKRELKELFK